MSSEISPLVASKRPCRSEGFSKGFLNRLVMTLACDSPFRLPCCDAFPETRQDSGEGKLLSRFRKAIKINPELEPVMLEPRSRCGLKAFPSSATTGRNSRSGCFQDESLPCYVGRVLMRLQAPRRTCWTPMVLQAGAEITLRFHFKALLSYYRILPILQ